MLKLAVLIPLAVAVLATPAAAAGRAICEFEAADAEKVRASYRSAGVNLKKVWTAEVFSRDEPATSY